MHRLSIQEELAQIVGAGNVSVDAQDCDLSTSDIFDWPNRKPAIAVVRPASTAEVARVVALLRQHRIPVLPRGAGLSYTGGLAIETDAVTIDTERISSISVDQAHQTATVGAGASWASVAATLKASNLRSLQPSPISGAFSTVGGLASQGLPAGTDGILAVTVVLPDGSIVRTGASSTAVRAVPDLTGIFLGDCGAYGIKTEIVIRVGTIPPVAFATFEFESPGDMIDCLSLCLCEGLISRAFAMDRAKEDQAKSVDVGEAVNASLSVLRDSGSVVSAARNAAKLMGLAARRRPSIGWSLHLTIESATSAGANAQLQRVREICEKAGLEVSDIFPRTLYSRPYSVRGFLGTAGERWVPVHGIFGVAESKGAFAALQSYFDQHADEMSAHGISASWLISSSGPYILIEPMLYWPDKLDPIHMKYLSQRNRERFGSFAENPEARNVVRSLRLGIREVMDGNGAIHCQIGRFYEHARQTDPGALALLKQIKLSLDPDRLINPGVLSLG